MNSISAANSQISALSILNSNSNNYAASLARLSKALNQACWSVPNKSLFLKQFVDHICTTKSKDTIFEIFDRLQAALTNPPSCPQAKTILSEIQVYFTTQILPSFSQYLPRIDKMYSFRLLYLPQLLMNLITVSNGFYEDLAKYYPAYPPFGQVGSPPFLSPYQQLLTQDHPWTFDLIKKLPENLQALFTSRENILALKLKILHSLFPSNPHIVNS